MSMKRPANRTGAGGKPHVADSKRNGSECCLTEADVVQWIASHERQWKGHLRKLSYNVLVQWAHVLEVSIYKDKGKLPKDQLCEYVSKKAAEVAKVEEKRSHPPLLDSTQQPPAKKACISIASRAITGDAPSVRQHASPDRSDRTPGAESQGPSYTRSKMEAYRIARNLYELQRLTVQMGEAIAEDRSREAFPDMYLNSREASSVLRCKCVAPC